MAAMTMASPAFPLAERSTGSGIVSAAQSQKGIPYVWGGGGCGGPSKGGYDCSG